MLTLAFLLIVVLAAAAVTEGAAASVPKRTARDALISNLNYALRGTPMAGTGRQLELAGRQSGVHPALLVGIAGVEGDYGRAACLPFNPFGISSCGNAWRAPTFRSWGHAYTYTARFLKSRWPRARTPWDFHGYCVDRYGNDCPDWPEAVAYRMRLAGYRPVVSYP